MNRWLLLVVAGLMASCGSERRDASDVRAALGRDRNPFEDCTNGIDDDDDGQTDCADFECRPHPDCEACDSAEQLFCGTPISGDTQDGSNRYTQYSCAPGSTWDGPEIAFFIEVAPATPLSAVLVPAEGAELDLFLVQPCDPEGCLEASTEAFPGPDSIQFEMTGSRAYLVVDGVAGDNTFVLGVDCEDVESCVNEIDDDEDGMTDCDDSDCHDHPACSGPETDCDNEIDDDVDGFTDCDDPHCWGDPYCETPTEDCDNGRDDDGDQDVDCDDTDCFGHHLCGGSQEVCDNDLDDDGDGDTDCDDADCSDHPDCQGPQEDCDNGVDDDVDGATDCDDPDCDDHIACQVLEDCDNGVDDDEDGATDCDDSDCSEEPACKYPPEDCGNGIDDDMDGRTDCADYECGSDPRCMLPEDCQNGKDDDGDGDIDCADIECVNEPVCIPDELCNNGRDDDQDGDTDCEDEDCEEHEDCEGKTGSGDDSCGCGAAFPVSLPAFGLILACAFLAGLRGRNRREGQ